MYILFDEQPTSQTQRESKKKKLSLRGKQKSYKNTTTNELDKIPLLMLCVKKEKEEKKQENKLVDDKKKKIAQFF